MADNKILADIVAVADIVEAVWVGVLLLIVLANAYKPSPMDFPMLSID